MLPLASTPAADQLTELVTAALIADGRLESADSLYAPGAEILADGRRRNTLPRFAGVEAGGEVVVGSIRVDLTAAVAWTSVEYRWVAQQQNLIREGRATFVLIRSTSDGKWRVAQAHSSTAS